MKTLLGNHRTTLTQDAALLIARIGIGAVLIAHGWTKIHDQGFSATSGGFDQMGIPLPDAAAAYAIGVELVGGAMLILGVLTPLAALLVIGDMAGAFWFAHRGNGIFVDQGGWELVGMIAAVALVVGAMGAGRLSVDRLVLGSTEEAPEPAPQPDAARESVRAGHRETLSR